MALSSDEVNYLVYRYLVESGFGHTAFCFGNESFLHKAHINPNDVPPGALISFIQKGLQYLELEANCNDDGTVADGDFSLLTSHDLLTKDIDELKCIVRDRKEAAERANEQEGNPMEEDVEEEQVTTLKGHSSEVFICAWSPTEDLLASGSGDSTARIWNLGPDGKPNQPAVLYHTTSNARGDKSSPSKDVTTLDWNPEGSLLATGAYDGIARIWTKDGKLERTLEKHQGPIFSLKWNKSGDLLLSGSVDKTAIVWDTQTGEAKQQYHCHDGATLDVDWKNDDTFATCSTDKAIYVCRVGAAKPIARFAGHADEVNAIKWDPSGQLLASCSDDRTAKIWRLDGERPAHNLAGHRQEVYTIRWSPTGRGTANPDAPLLLATTSFDTTVKLWDADTGACVMTLNHHHKPVYSMGFSPDARFLASGSFDKQLLIWSLKDGALIKSYKGDGGIFEVCWNRTATLLAACYASKILTVLDTRPAATSQGGGGGS